MSKIEQGDIVYAHGPLNHKQFAVVSKITTTGKFRLDYIDKQEIVGENESKDYIEREVLPLQRKTGKSVLVSAKGYCSKDRLLFRKYDPNKKLTDVVFDI
ncbi:MAG TPA: hypothetical protein PKD85_21725, partial [Saprospiraceae bacterium]|nr:hypothetical protein [Saprospiraceae bacterium]